MTFNNIENVKKWFALRGKPFDTGELTEEQLLVLCDDFFNSLEDEYIGTKADPTQQNSFPRVNFDGTPINDKDFITANMYYIEMLTLGDNLLDPNYITRDDFVTTEKIGELHNTYDVEGMLRNGFIGDVPPVLIRYLKKYLKPYDAYSITVTR